MLCWDAYKQFASATRLLWEEFHYHQRVLCNMQLYLTGLVSFCCQYLCSKPCRYEYNAPAAANGVACILLQHQCSKQSIMCLTLHEREWIRRSIHALTIKKKCNFIFPWYPPPLPLFKPKHDIAIKGDNEARAFAYPYVILHFHSNAHNSSFFLARVWCNQCIDDFSLRLLHSILKRSSTHSLNGGQFQVLPHCTLAFKLITLIGYVAKELI